MTENKNLNSIRKRISKLRVRKTMRELSEKALISHGHINNIIDGRRKATPEIIKRLDMALRSMGL